MTQQNPGKKDLHWIQALRGIAALMVLFFHMHPHWDMVPLLSTTSIVTRWGFSGVDIFFALSGFVVYRSAHRSIPKHGIWPFMRKRLLRIYLGYWPVLLLIAGITVFLYESDLPPLKNTVFSALLLYPNISDNWLPPAWSLTTEIYFYSWIALIALLPQRHQIKAIIGVMALLAAWGLGWLIADLPRVFSGHQPLRFVFTAMGLEFLGGALLSHAYERRANWFRRPGLTATLCTALMAGGIAIGMTSPFFDRVEIMRATSFGVMGLSALLLAITLEQTRLTPPSWLVAVGDSSYSLYLLHTFLLDASGRIRLIHDISTPSQLLPFLLALPVAIVLLSLLWYRLIERPLMKAAL